MCIEAARPNDNIEDGDELFLDVHAQDGMSFGEPLDATDGPITHGTESKTPIEEAAKTRDP